MSDSPEVSVLIHELGGMLSSVQGFAHIAEANPEHPNRERYIALAASEARRAARALKDLHLVRALDRGSLAASPPPVEASAVVGAAAREASLGDAAFPELAGVRIAVDPPKVVSLLGRTWALAVAPVAVVTEEGRADLVIPLAGADQLARRSQALDAPHPDMVVPSLLRRILRHWGGDVMLAVRGEWTVAVVALPRV
jgi:signal transduction histidine kinase